MTHTTKTTTILALAIAALVIGAPAAAYRCLPSCAADDGRMIGTTANGFANTVDFGTMAMDVQIVLAQTATSFEVGIFDPDDKGLNQGGLWDADFDAEPGILRYTLCEDADGDGVCGTVLFDELSNGATLAAADNAWHTINVTTSASAQAVSGFFFYNLHIEAATTETGEARWNMYKLRVSDNATMYVPEGPAIGFGVPVISQAEYDIIYPGGGTSPTTYDGTWDFTLQVDDPALMGGLETAEVRFWDGDFDFGATAGQSVSSSEGDQTCFSGSDPSPYEASYDTNDKDTQATDFPQFVAAAGGAATAGVSAESGEAQGGFDGSGNPIVCFTLGSPPDDWPLDSGSSGVFKRSPAAGSQLNYSVTAPGGAVYANMNPSGNREYEQFVISSLSGCDDSTASAIADFCVGSALPTGAYRLSVDGMDVTNINHLVAPLCVGGQLGHCTRETTCMPCDGKVTRATFQYNGTAPATVELVQNKSQGNATRFGPATVNPGEWFSATGNDRQGALGTEIDIFVNGVHNGGAHTSCSAAFGPGLVIGDFEVVRAYSRNGGFMCSLPPGTTQKTTATTSGGGRRRLQASSATSTGSGGGRRR